MGWTVPRPSYARTRGPGFAGRVLWPCTPWPCGDAVELLVEVGETADVLAVDGERQLLDACGSAADAGGVGVAAGAKELELEVRGSSSFEAVDAEVGHHGLAVAVADGGDDLLVLGAGELVEEDAVGRLVDAEAPDVADDVGDGIRRC